MADPTATAGSKDEVLKEADIVAIKAALTKSSGIKPTTIAAINEKSTTTTRAVLARQVMIAHGIFDKAMAQYGL